MPYRIFVADASPSVQKTVQMVFQEPDFRLCCCDSGNGLLDSLTALQPDTILLSLSLPDADSYEIARAVSSREELKRVPLFFLKGTFELFDSERAEGLSYEAVVQKPFDSERLAAMVREAIERKLTPTTMPEEAALDEVMAGPPPVHGTGSAAAGAPSQTDEGFRTRVREIVKQEVLDMERELEKRIKARVLADLKEKA